MTTVFIGVRLTKTKRTVRSITEPDIQRLKQSRGLGALGFPLEIACLRPARKSTPSARIVFLSANLSIMLRRARTHCTHTHTRKRSNVCCSPNGGGDREVYEIHRVPRLIQASGDTHTTAGWIYERPVRTRPGDINHTGRDGGARRTRAKNVKIKRAKLARSGASREPISRGDGTRVFAPAGDDRSAGWGGGRGSTREGSS